MASRSLPDVIEVNHPQGDPRAGGVRIGRIRSFCAQSVDREPDEAGRIDRIEIIRRRLVDETAVTDLQMMQPGLPEFQFALEAMPLGETDRSSQIERDDAAAMFGR